MTVDVLRPDFSTVRGLQILDVVAERNTDSVGSAEEVLSDGGDLSTIADSNRAIITVGVIVTRLLVVLQLRKSHYLRDSEEY